MLCALLPASLFGPDVSQLMRKVAGRFSQAPADALLYILLLAALSAFCETVSLDVVGGEGSNSN